MNPPKGATEEPCRFCGARAWYLAPFVGHAEPVCAPFAIRADLARGYADAKQKLFGALS